MGLFCGCFLFADGLSGERYFSVKIEDKLFGDLIWYYLYPIAMCGAIAGRFCINPSGKDVRVLVDDVELTE